MNYREIQQWASDFDAYIARFEDLFVRREPREQMPKYVRALLSDVKRKNSWQLAERIGDLVPNKTQRLLNNARWDADAARDELLYFVAENLDDPEGILIFDETGFLKKGTKSAGVQRQYCGTAGKVENCQVGVFASYLGRGSGTLVDRRLFLPEAWAKDAERRRKARIPDEVQFATKPELARQIFHTVRQYLHVAWVTGDEVYGSNAALRDAISATGSTHYVMAIRSQRAPKGNASGAAKGNATSA